MEVIVPFSATRPKSRLADVLSRAERTAFARAMLDDVLSAVVDAGGEPRVLATDDFDPAGDPLIDADPSVTVDARPLTEAVNAVLADRRPGEDVDALGVVMADLALATPEALRRLLDAAEHGDADAVPDVTIAPGRGGGTNALAVRDPSFRVDYHGASYLDHRQGAAEVAASVRAVDSYRLATDIDERDDLAELLIHGEGSAAAWLREAGFVLDTGPGRVGVARE